MLIFKFSLYHYIAYFVQLFGSAIMITGLKTVATPAQQRSQVISRSENPPARSPGCTFFLKKVDDLFLF